MALCLSSHANAVGTADLDLDSAPNRDPLCRANCAWQTQVGADRNERLAASIILDDGTIVVTGSTESTRFTGTAGWAFQLSDSGHLEWQRVVAAPGSIVLEGLAQRRDGTLVMVGRAFIREDSHGGQTDVLVVEMDRSGDVLNRWVVSAGGQQGAAAVAMLEDGSLVLAGYAERPEGNRAARITLIGPDRQIAWEQVVDAEYGATALDAAVVGDRIAVVGSARGADREAYAWLRTFDRDGFVLSDSVLARGRRASATAVAVTGHDTLVVGGLEQSDARLSGFVAELGLDGQPLWSRRVTSPDGGDARIEDVAVARDGSLLAAGELAGDGVVLRFADGEVAWESRYGTATGRDSITSVAELANGDIVATGWITNARDGDRNTDAWVIRVDNHGGAAQR
ncbi:MAG: hypothetical protein KDA49_16960 [Rhodospirillaceae bacterium]|nr:hypothetical protein [Rhodospirillaceae bacterium]